MVFLQAAPQSLHPIPNTSATADGRKRKRLTGSERRAQCLEIAQELFATHGYHHISMDDIASAAKVTKPVLYKHFPSKLELYLAIIDDLSRTLVSLAHQELEQAAAQTLLETHPAAAVPGQLTALPATSLEPEASPTPSGPIEYRYIKAVLDAYVGFVQDTGVAASLLLESDVTRDIDLREKLWESGTHISHELVSHASLRGSRSPTNIHEFADIVVSLGRHVATEMLRKSSESSPQHTPRTEHIAHFAWRGLSGWPS